MYPSYYAKSDSSRALAGKHPFFAGAASGATSSEGWQRSPAGSTPNLVGREQDTRSYHGSYQSPNWQLPIIGFQKAQNAQCSWTVVLWALRSSRQLP
jgi:hypothetical protein